MPWQRGKCATKLDKSQEIYHRNSGADDTSGSLYKSYFIQVKIFKRYFWKIKLQSTKASMISHLGLLAQGEYAHSNFLISKEERKMKRGKNSRENIL